MHGCMPMYASLMRHAGQSCKTMGANSRDRLSSGTDLGGQQEDGRGALSTLEAPHPGLRTSSCMPVNHILTRNSSKMAFLHTG